MPKIAETLFVIANSPLLETTHCFIQTTSSCMRSNHQTMVESDLAFTLQTTVFPQMTCHFLQTTRSHQVELDLAFNLQAAYLFHVELGLDFISHTAYTCKRHVILNTLIPGQARPHSHSAYDTISQEQSWSSPLSPSSCVRHMSTNDLSS